MTDKQQPPATMRVQFCSACGRDDRVSSFKDRHYSYGALCDGVPITIPYARVHQVDDAPAGEIRGDISNAVGRWANEHPEINKHLRFDMLSTLVDGVLSALPQLSSSGPSEVERLNQRIAELERRLKIPFGKLPCALCGGPHDFDTSVPSVIWNNVIRVKGLPDYLCTTCIVREFVRQGQSFTAVLWNEEFNGVPIEIVVNGQNAKDAAAIEDENNSLRNQFSSSERRCVECHHIGSPKNGICQEIVRLEPVTNAQLDAMHQEFRGEAGVIRCGCKCVFPATGAAPCLLTLSELADIEHFQKQRRKNPVPQDAWLYIAEIDRLLGHIHATTGAGEGEQRDEVGEGTKIQCADCWQQIGRDEQHTCPQQVRQNRRKRQS